MLSGVRRLALTAVLAMLATASVAAAAPYSFITEPTDQIGVPGFAAGTEITPEGYLYTGSAEIVLRRREVPPVARVEAWRVRTRLLTDGRYPVLHSAATAGHVRYTLTTFAAKVGGGPVDFVRVRMHNTCRCTARAGWGIGTRYTGGERKANGARRFRYIRPATPPRTGLYYQPGYGWNPHSSYAFAGRAFLRSI